MICMTCDVPSPWTPGVRALLLNVDGEQADLRSPTSGSGVRPSSP
jgi:hypothetical protein